MPIKISDQNGNTTSSKLAEAIDWARANGANVINASVSDPGSSPLADAIANAYLQDIVVVAAMGNFNNSTVYYPAGYPTVIAVGATNQTDARVVPGPGVTWGSNYGSHIDVVAPGIGHYTTARYQSVTSFGGTSCATPFVSGAAGLIIAESRDRGLNLTNDDVKHLLESTADKVSGMGGQDWTQEYGFGRVNAATALAYLNPPYGVTAATLTNGTVTQTANNENWIFIGVPGLAGGTYLGVNQYRITWHVNFPHPYAEPPLVWARERSIVGYNGANPQTGAPYAKIMNVTQSGFDVQTFAYFVGRDFGNNPINRYFPGNSTSLQASIAYTAVGRECQLLTGQSVTSVTIQPAPGYVKVSHNLLEGVTGYNANAAASPSGTFYPRGQSYATLPAWVNMTSCYPPCLVSEVDTNLWYWNVTGMVTGCGATSPSSVIGPIGAWHLKSASAAATKNNNQRKIVRKSYPAQYAMVYESGGDIFYSHSTNQGTTWLPEELVSSGNATASNPSLEKLVYYISMNSYDESYVVWEENPVGANGYRIWGRKRNNYEDTWGSIVLLHENLSARPTAAQPVVSGFYTFWRGPAGILWRYFGDGYYTTVHSVPGTDANSNSPSVEILSFYGGQVHLAWEQTGAGVRYCKGFVDGESESWNQVLSIADNTGLTSNAKPTVVLDAEFPPNACIAWEYRFITNGSIKFRRVDPNGQLSSVTTFPNPPGANRVPSGPSILHHEASYSAPNNLILTWTTPTDGVIGVFYRNAAWQNPFVLSQSGQHVQLPLRADDANQLNVPPPNAMFMATQGTPYRIHTLVMPTTTPAPLSPALLYPTNGATGVLVPANLTWDYVIGASTYRLQVDDNSDFSSPAIDVSGWTATNYYASLNTYTTYWWRVNATSPYGTSNWSTVWQFTTGDQLPPGCPFVYTWDGKGFVEDNNILPQSLEPGNAGIDVLDFYRLMKPLVARNDKYTLHVREDGEDYSRLDNVALVAVDHPAYVDVAMKDDGSVLSYFKPFSLSRAHLRDRDVMRELSNFDSLAVDVSGDFLDFGFHRSTSPGTPFVPEWKEQSDSPLGPGDDGEVVIEAGGSGEDPPTDAIGRPVLTSNGTTDGSFSPSEGARFRHNASLVYIPLTIADTNNLQMQWPGVVSLDYLNLGVKVPARITVRELALQRAVHDSLGVVTQALSSADGIYAELTQRHRIELTFAAPSMPPTLQRTFFFVSAGRYDHIGDSPSNQLGKPASIQASGGKPIQFALHHNFPNPFNPSTAIKYDLPTDVHVTLRVYDMLGRTVATLFDEVQQSGYHQYQFDASNMASGVYFYFLNAGEFSSVKKLLLLR